MLDQIPTTDKSLYIQKRYPVTNKEFDELNDKYGKLCWFAASKLAYANRRSEEDLQDFHSDIQMGMFRAGSYFKRQTFIEGVFEYLDKCKIYMTAGDIDDLNTLKELWQRKSDFNEVHEEIIRELLSKYEDSIEDEIPTEDMKLELDENFEVYCKAIIWNTKKSLGQNISKENEHKSKEISLDEWSFLEGGDVRRSITEGISYSNNNNYIHSDFKSIRNQLSGLEDKRPLKTFDIIMDPENHDAVFKQKKGKKEGIKINVVRKKTNMSYRTINKQLKTIKKIIQREMDM